MKRVAIVLVLVAVAGALWWWVRGAGPADAPASAARGQPAAAPGKLASAPAAAPLARLIVSVSDDRGPLADALVRVAPARGEIAIVRTGHDGVAELAIAAGSWKISASAPDHEPRATERELAADRDTRVELRLALGGRALVGIVTDATGGPIAGARIDAARLGALAKPVDAIASTLTGADGRYRLTVAEGALVVAASNPDYAPETRYVDVGERGATADFALVPGGVVEGVVIDERTREPVAGATVEAARDGGVLRLGEARARAVATAADGHFRIAGLRPGGYELAARAAGRASRQPTTIGLGVAEQLRGLELAIAAGAAIRGRVVDDSGAAVAGVQVEAHGERHAHDAPTDAAGAFVIDGVGAGRYQLGVRTPSHASVAPVVVEVGARDVDGVRIVVRRAIYVRGHVEPRQRCDVSLELDERTLATPQDVAPTASGDDGAFALGPVAPGAALVRARCASGDQGAAAVAIAPGVADVIVAVAGGATIAGRVVDRGGKPVIGATVVGSPLGANDSESVQMTNGVVTSGVQARTSASGAFELRGLAAGGYRLGVLDRGRPMRLRGKPPRLALADAEHKTGVELVVERADGKIAGTVVDAAGKPVADAWVSVHEDLEALVAGMLAGGDDRDGGDRGKPGAGSTSSSRFVSVSDDGAAAEPIAPALTDASGHFELVGLPHSTFDVVAEAGTGRQRGRTARVTPDAQITITIAGVAELSGVVRGLGRASAFAVELVGPAGAQRRSFDAADGAFRFGRVDPGSYAVHVTSSAGNGDARVEVAAGTPATVEVTLAANATVIGKLADAAGKPLAGLPVVVIDDPGPSGHLSVSLDGPPPTSAADGSFRLDAKAGKRALLVLVHPTPTTRLGLELQPGQTLDLGTITVDSRSPPP